MGLKSGRLRSGLRNISTGGPAIPDSGVSHWTFNDADTDTGTAIDIWNGHDATINGATTSATGANQTYTTNESYDFDGTDDYVQASVQTPFEPASLSISVWVYARSAGDSNLGGIFSKEKSGTTYDGYSAWIRDDGNWYWRTDGKSDIIAPSSLNEWRHLVFTFDGGTGDKKIFDNATEVATGSGTVTHVANDVTVGAWASDLTRVFDGRIDDPRFYNKALTSTEVSNLYQTGSING